MRKRVPVAALVAALGLPFAASSQDVSFLHRFTGLAGEGQQPVSPPLYDAGSDRLYGVATRAGLNASGFGTDTRALVYRLAPDGTAFGASVSGQRDAGSTLVADGKGRFYFGVEGNANRLLRFSTEDLAPVVVWGQSGTGLMGLRGGLSASADGTIFFPYGMSNQARLARLTDGVATDIKVWDSFETDSADVVSPAATILAGDGYLYGVADKVQAGEGSQAVLYRIRPDGSGYARLKVFDDASGYPASARYITTGDVRFSHAVFSGLAEGGDGWIYGTTFRAGADAASVDPKGRLYRVAQIAGADGRHAFEILHVFAGGEADGEAAHGPLAVASDGHLYGTTLRGGKEDKGTLFQLKLRDGDGRILGQAGAVLPYAKVYDFADGEGQAPVGVSVAPGKLFGATWQGGEQGMGTVFAVTLASPVVRFAQPLAVAPASGQAPLAVSLSWAAENVEGACQATASLNGQPSAVWQGEGKQPSVAAEALTLAQAGEYVLTLTCANVDGVAAVSEARVTVEAKPDEPANPDDGGSVAPSSSGGGGLLGGLALMPLTGLWARRRR